MVERYSTRWGTLGLIGLVYAVSATVPLVWVQLFGTTISAYHLVGLLVILVMPFVDEFRDAVGKVARSGFLWWIGTGILALAMLVSYTKSVWIYEPFFTVKFIGFAAASFAIASLAYVVIQRGAFAYLAFVPAVAGAVFAVFISFQFAFADIQPLELFSLAIARADPNIITNKLFRAAFRAANEGSDIRSNLKQGLSLAFVCTIPIGYLALSYIPKGKPVARAVAIAGIAFAIFMSIIPFSRAAWLSLFIVAVCLSVVYVRRPMTLLMLLTTVFVIVPTVLYVTAESRIVTLIGTRMESQTSVNARVEASQSHWEAIGNSPFFGGTARLDQWAHNVIIDSWSTFGLFGLVGALLSTVALLLLLGTALSKTLTAPITHRKVHATIAALICPALVRMFTSPNITIDFPVWIALGFGIGLAADAWTKSAINPQAAGSQGYELGKWSAT